MRKRVGDGGGVGERDGRRELVVDEVIGHEQRRDPRTFGAAGELGEVLRRRGVVRDQSEAELAVVGHGVTMPRRGTGRAQW